MSTRRPHSLTASLALAGFIASSALAASPQSVSPPRRAPSARSPVAPSNGPARRPKFTEYCTPGNGFSGAGYETCAGYLSGVLSGYYNEASGSEDGVGSGRDNEIYANGGFDQDSFIGGGEINAIYGNGQGGTYDSFIGAGQSNSVTAIGAAIGAGSGNLIAPAAEYGFVGAGQSNVAGGSEAGVVAGSSNKVSGTYSFVGAGQGNLGLGPDSAVGAGQSNIAGLALLGTFTSNAFVGAGASNAASGNDSFVGAGLQNHAPNDYSFVGAGSGNTAGLTAFVGAGSANKSSGQNSFVGAGYGNVSAGAGSFVGAGGMAFFEAGNSTQNSAAGIDAFVGAGDGNAAAGVAAVVAGGQRNAAPGALATVSGGSDSSATGKWATIPGGYLNAAGGVGSFAAGTQAKARHPGAFVWSDTSSGSPLQSTAADQFVARASGGFYLFSNAKANAGVRLAPGSGTWSSLSDRSMKTDVSALDDATVLAKVAALPVSEWSYLSERGVRHLGPMAQDFYAAFRVGEDDRHIATLDEDGVALAAIKALHAESRSLRARLTRTDARVAELERKLDALAKQVRLR